MDTNLKSSRKIRTIITIVILSLFAAGIVGSYYMVSRNNIASTVTVEEDIEDCIERLDYSLATGNRILYNEVTGVKDASEQMEMMSNSAFSLFKKYMDYQIFDKEGNPLFKESDDQICTLIMIYFRICINGINTKYDSDHYFRNSEFSFHLFYSCCLIHICNDQKIGLQFFYQQETESIYK